MLHIRNFRFGGEGGGMPAVVNFAPCTPHDIAERVQLFPAGLSDVQGYPLRTDACVPVLAPYGGVALCQRPPRSGPIADELVPAKGSSIIIEGCTLNDHNNYRRPADVWLEEVPNLLVMRGNVGMTRGFFSNATRKYHYEAVFGGGWANLSAVGVSPAIDLDGPYLAAASSGMWRGELATGLSERGVRGHGPRLEIADDNWNYPLAFRRLPRQLQPFAGSDSDSGAAQDMEGVKRQLREAR